MGDALGDQVEPSLGKEYKEYVEKRLATLEESGMRSLTKGISKPSQGKFEKSASSTKSGSAQYSKDADAVEEPVKKKRKKSDAAEGEAPKKKKRKASAEEEEPVEEEAPKKKKKKKSVVEEEE